MIKVLDLSRWNRKWDFGKAKSRGVGGCILKASQFRPDPFFEINWPELQTSGLKAGAYHYFVPSKDAGEQAELFAGLVKSSQVEMGLWLDLEYNAKADGANEHPGKFKDYGLRVLRWLYQVEELTGVKPGIYTNPSHATVYLSKFEVFGSYELWIANPQEGSTRTVPNVPKPWWADGWRGWQFTWKLAAEYYGAPSDSIKGLDGSVFRW